MPTTDGKRPVEVDLLARAALLAIEIDDRYHLRDARRHRHARSKHVWLPRAGCFVVRFLAEEIEGRLERVMKQLALGAGARRASGSSVEDPR